MEHRVKLLLIKEKKKEKDYYKILNLWKIQVTLIVKIKYHGFSFFFQVKYRTKYMESSLLSKRNASFHFSLPFSPIFFQRKGWKKKRKNLGVGAISL